MYFWTRNTINSFFSLHFGGAGPGGDFRDAFCMGSTRTRSPETFKGH